MKYFFFGRWLRNLERYKKINLKNGYKIIKPKNYIDAIQYENILTNHLIFEDILDSSCNNVVLECIVRNTPIIVNKVPAIFEYLGDSYPLYYKDIDDIDRILNKNKIIEAYNYLKSIDKSKFDVDYYIKSILNSKIYNKL